MVNEKISVLSADQMKKGKDWFEAHKATCRFCQELEKFPGQERTLKPDVLTKVFSISAGKIIIKLCCMCSDGVDISEDFQGNSEQKREFEFSQMFREEIEFGRNWLESHSQRCKLFWQPIDGAIDCLSDEYLSYEFIDTREGFELRSIGCKCGEKIIVSEFFKARSGMIGLSD